MTTATPLRIAPPVDSRVEHLRQLLRRYRSEERRLLEELERAQRARDLLDETLRLRIFDETTDEMMESTSLGWTAATEHIELVAHELVHVRDTIAGVREELARRAELAA